MPMELDNFRKTPDSLSQADDSLRASHERAALGLTYDDLLAFIQRLELAARTHHISHEKLLQQVFDALEQMDQYTAMDALVGVKREELAQLEEQVNRGVSRQQAEIDRLMEIEILVEARKEESAHLGELVNKYNAEVDRLKEIASARQQELERLGQLQSFGELVHAGMQKAGEETEASVRDMAQVLRSELDRLLKEVMDLAGKAAQIDADLRSHEWLNRLLMLVEGRDDLKPAEVRHLALTIMRSVSRWLDRHQQEPLSGSQRDLQRLLNTFQEWQA